MITIALLFSFLTFCLMARIAWLQYKARTAPKKLYLITYDRSSIADLRRLNTNHDTKILTFKPRGPNEQN